MSRYFLEGKCSLENKHSKDLCGCALIDGEIACINCLERQARFEAKCIKNCEKCEYADYSVDCFSGKEQLNCLCMDNID